MKNLEFNKIFASLLIALLMAMIVTLIGDGLISPRVDLTKKSYPITIKEMVVSSSSAAQKPLEPISQKLNTANIDNGEKVFKKCMQCHSIEQGKNLIGPSLWHVVGRAIASLTDYAYSSAIKEKSADHWDVENLNIFLHKPSAYIKGTKMTFAGLENEQERIDVIGFLSQKSKS